MVKGTNSVLHGDIGGAEVQQGKAVQQQGQVGDLRQHPGRLDLLVTPPHPPHPAPAAH